MFYAQFVLSKKGPLAKIWLAAHWEKKLSKAQIYETDVDEAVDEIMKPKSKMALRTTGHLLLGIVRIYSRKTKYLLADCNEAFLKIKMAFRPGQLDLMPDTAPIQSITLPDVFVDYDASLPDFNIDFDFPNPPQISQSRIDDITLKEDHITNCSTMFNDFGMDDFGDNGGICFEDEFRDFAQEFARAEASSSGFPGDLREGTPLLENIRAPGNTIFDDDFGDAGGGCEDDDDVMTDNMSGIVALHQPEPSHINDDAQSHVSFARSATLDRETFALEPLDPFCERPEKKKKKRRLLIDDQKNISGDAMKANMADYSDTLQTLDLAPPTKKLMLLRESGTVEKLFHFPGCQGMKNKALVRLYQSFLSYKAHPENVIRTNTDLQQELGLGEIREEEIRNFHEFPAPDNHFADDFEDVGVADFDNIGPATPPPMEPMERPVSPAKESDEFSPPEKKKRRAELQARGAAAEEEEGDEDDHRWTKRTQNVLNSISGKIKSNADGEITLSDLLNKGSTRKTAAQKFYTLLVLKKWQAIEVEQAKPYEEITITAGPNIAQNSRTDVLASRRVISAASVPSAVTSTETISELYSNVTKNVLALDLVATPISVSFDYILEGGWVC
ncbi:unnamed protein product [Caenorhabditis auriculariae]|uniref:Uncharacterized protein n=1 Tax=Caenorhabditis auriculariae TaxID=2777116 RepID=A0A8S1H221_9PELO|nr:unnamed protein product [Caenorhabditis auriculariae]